MTKNEILKYVNKDDVMWPSYLIKLSDGNYIIIKQSDNPPIEEGHDVAGYYILNPSDLTIDGGEIDVDEYTDKNDCINAVVDFQYLDNDIPSYVILDEKISDSDWYHFVYTLYIFDWINNHIYDELLNFVRVNYTLESKKNGQDFYPDFASYVYTFGFDGSVYVCFDEFMDNEFNDDEYIKSLLDLNVDE